MTPDASSPGGPPQLDLRFIRQVWRVVCIAFASRPRQASLLAAAMLVTAVGQKILEYYVGLLPSRFYAVLPTRDSHSFYHLLLKALCYIFGIALVKALAQFCTQLVYVTWRHDLVEHIQKLYTEDNAFFDLNCVSHRVDNPDQRITQDVDRFCNQFSKRLLNLILSPFTIVFYSYKTWTQVGWFAPVFVYIFFLIGVAINRMLVALIVPIVVEQEKLEGDFRYHHVQLRTRSEAVAFYGAGSLEGEKLLATYMRLFVTQKRIVYRQLLLLFSINAFDYLGAFLSYVIIAIPILAGAYSDADLSSIISRASFQTIYLISQFTQLLDISTNFSRIAAYVYRINGLLDALSESKKSEDRRQDGGGVLSRAFSGACDRFRCYRRSGNGSGGAALIRSVRTDVRNDDGGGVDDDGDPGDGRSGGCGRATDDWRSPENGRPEPVFHLEAVSFRPPSDHTVVPLVSDLNLDIYPDSGILITGQTGTGKSSLLRVLRGLWPARGDVWRRVVGADVAFLPQKPFLTVGCLAQQVAYPKTIVETSFRLSSHRQSPSSEDLGEEGRLLSSVTASINDVPLLEDSDIDSEDCAHQGGDSEERVVASLRSVGLACLIDRCGGDVMRELDWSWYATLSPGESQRMAFARLLYLKPTMAFLDEATSALDDDSAYELLCQCRARGITLVAVTHHRTAYEKEFFSQELHLEGKGEWTLRSL